MTPPPDIAYSVIIAPLDGRLSPTDRHVLGLIARWPHATLDGLCAKTRTPRPYVFMAVARLEDYGLIPMGAIR